MKTFAARRQFRHTITRLDAASATLAPAWLWTLTSAMLVLTAWQGWYTRYAADDYATAADVRADGWFVAQWHWYTGWSGRFASAAVTASLDRVGAWVTSWLALLLLAGWVALILWTLRIWRLTALRLPALVLLAGWVISVPAQRQVLYWQTGLVTYALPLLLTTALVGLTGVRRRWSALLALLLACVVAGCSETVGVPLLAGALALLALARWRRWPYRAPSAAIVAGSALGTALLVLAPGNAVRQSYFPPHPPLVIVALHTPGMTALALLRVILGPALLAAPLMLVLTAWATARQGAPRYRIRYPVAATVTAFALCAASVAPAVYAYDAPPPGRALAAPTLLLLLPWLAWGHWLGARRPGHRARYQLAAIVLASLVLLPALLTDAVQMLPRARQAREYDHRALMIRAARPGPVTVPGLPSVPGLDTIGPDATGWVNIAAARYYGVAAITAR